VDVLTQLDERDHHPGVLAVRDLTRPRHLRVLLQDDQDLPAGLGALAPERAIERVQHVGLEVPVGVDAELLDGVRDRRDVDRSHAGLPPRCATARS
jgi:hypothetical protein